MRTAADLLLALALFGLPQSMVHAINQRGASASALERLSWRYAAMLLAAALVASVLFASGAGAVLLPPWLSGSGALPALLGGCVGWVLQGLLRVFALCRGTARQFAWASVMPSLMLLLGVLGLLTAGSQRYEWALALSGLASALLTAWQLRPLRARPGWAQGEPAPLAGLLVDGGHAFAQTVTQALQAWVSLHLMQWHDATVAELGRFVFAAYVLQAFGLPTSFVAPLMFARISEAAGAGRRYAAGGILTRVLGLSALAALLGVGLLPVVVPLLFGPAYVAAVPACQLLALAGPLLVANRLGVAVLFGQGRFRLATLHALLRAMAVPAGLWLAWRMGGLDVVTGAAAGWLLAEAAGALAMAWIWIGLPLRPAE